MKSSELNRAEEEIILKNCQNAKMKTKLLIKTKGFSSLQNLFHTLLFKIVSVNLFRQTDLLIEAKWKVLAVCRIYFTPCYSRSNKSVSSDRQISWSMPSGKDLAVCRIYFILHIHECISHQSVSLDRQISWSKPIGKSQRSPT